MTRDLLDDLTQIERVLTHVLHHQITATHRARQGISVARDRARQAIQREQARQKAVAENKEL
jgi:hypothetical protein